MNIRNETEKVTIELFGDIGESWFEEGNTMESLNADIKAAIGKPIDLIVSSLGGSVDHALAMHDLLKMHNAPVTAKIIGATASSGTIVAMGASKVEMSENALFLVHNAWTMTMGNANELREAADELDVWDSRIVNIYKNKTGKRKSQIHSLMEEEKWIDADEAKSFGFIDNTFKPTAQAKILTSDEKQDILNKIKIVMNKEFKEVNSLLEIEGLVIDEEKGTYLQTEQLEVINKALLIDHTEAIATAVNEVEDAHKLVVEDLQTKQTELETEKTKIEADHETAVEDSIKVLADLQTKFNAMETEYNASKAKGMKLNNGEPPLLETELTDKEKKHASNAKTVFGEIKKFKKL